MSDGIMGNPIISVKKKAEWKPFDGVDESFGSVVEKDHGRVFSSVALDQS